MLVVMVGNIGTQPREGNIDYFLGNIFATACYGGDAQCKSPVLLPPQPAYYYLLL